MSLDAGHRFEDAACEYLEARGLSCVARNVRYRFGEIDLVMRDAAGSLVFVEVRARRGRAGLRFGGARASIDSNKQMRLQLAARRFLLRYRNRPPECRFDVVLFENGEVEWLRNAFDATG
ncbi:MAG: YraN family protein [Pararobbsia sp.]